MVVGQFNDSFPPVVDGVANVCLNYSREISRRGDRCVVVSPRFSFDKNGNAGDYPFEYMTFNSFKVPTRNEYRWGVGVLDARFWKDVKDIPFDIVHTHCPFSTHQVAKAIARRHNIPIVTTFHSKYKDDFRQATKSERLAEVVVKYIVSEYNKADDVWTVNDSSVETLREYGYKGDVFVLENGCDISPEDPSGQVKREIFSKYNLADQPLFMYIGQHDVKKNLPMLLESITTLRHRGRQFHVLFIGDGAYKHDMEGFVTQNGLTDFVTFAGTIRDRELVKKIYLSSTALLFPSLYDTSSLVPREAAACLCPTVFIDGSTTAQGITDGVNGFLSGNTPTEYAARLEYIIDNESIRDAAARCAREVVYRPWSVPVDVAVERYKYIIDKKKVGRKRSLVC